MSQHDLVIDNQTFPATRSDINSALQAQGSFQSGATAPGTTYAYQYWADTTNGVLWQRDSTNATWVLRATLSADITPAKTTTYTVLLGDHGKTIQCNATGGPFTVNFTAAATLGDGFEVTLMKSDSTVSKITLDANAAEKINNTTTGAATTITLDNQFEFVTISCDGTGLYVKSRGPKPIREILTAARTYYVDVTNGSDSNTGLAAGTGNAFATIQKAINVMHDTLDGGGFAGTIQLADGTYTAGGAVVGPFTGFSSITFNGNSGTPTNVIVSTTSANAIGGDLGASFIVQNMRLKTTTGGACLSAARGSTILFNNVDFNTSAGQHILCSDNSLAWANGNYTISGAATTHMYAQGQAEVRIDGITVTISGTPAFSAQFATALGLAYIEAVSVTYSGSATGTRYSAQSNSVISTGGGGATYLPGNVGGSTATGGQYL